MVRTVLCIALCISAHAAAAAPELEWRFETNGKIYASPVLADLDGDAKPEIIVAASRSRTLFCLDGQGEVLWRHRVVGENTDGIQATPSVADYDGDGLKEVFYLTKDGVFGCVDAGGRLRWRVLTDQPVDYSGPLAADINGDGRMEFVFGGEHGVLCCYDDTGSLLWQHQGDGPVRGIPAAAFHEPSGTMRVFAVFSGGAATCFDAEGNVLWSHHEESPRNERRSGPGLADVDNDGKLEVALAAERGTIIVRDAFSGQEEWRWQPDHKVDQTHSFAFADFGDGRLDIVCGGGSGQGSPGAVHRLRDGQALWSTDMGGGVIQGPSVGDVDGDGELEVMVCSRARKLFCLNADGAIEWTADMDAGTLTTPAIGDVDGDGETEIVVTSKDRYIYCFSVGGAYDRDRVPWPMLSGGPRLTGAYSPKPWQPSPAPAPLDAPLMAAEAPGRLRTAENTVTFKVTNACRYPRRLELSLCLTKPGGGVASQSTILPYEANEMQQTAFAFEALLAGTYALDARLTDVGSGQELAREALSFEMTPLAFERRRLGGLVRSIDELLEKAGGHVAERARAALQEREVRSVKTRDGLAADVIALLDLRAPEPARAQLGAMRAAVDYLSTGIDELERFEARAAAAVHGAQKGAFAVLPETSLKKVFRDEPFLRNGAEPGPWELALAANEYESIQAVVVPLWQDLSGVEVSVSALAAEDGAGSIPASDIEVRSVGYVETGMPEYNWPVEKAGDYPEVLWPAKPLDVPARQDAQPFFITVHTAPGTPTGTYKGSVTVTARDCEPVEVPLTVQVWDFALPEEWNLETSMWMSESSIRAFYQYEGEVPWDVLKRYYDMHLEHRVGPLKDFPLGGGDRVDDFEYLIPNGQNNLFIPVPEYLEPGEPREKYAKQLRETRALLEEKGWAGLAMFYTRDEVAVMGRHMIPEVVEMNAFIKEVIPEWPRLQTSAPEQALFGAVDIWCPTIDHFDPVILADRMAKGERLWFYTVWGRPGIMIDFPTTDYRIMFWQCWKYGADGFLYWGTTHWGFNLEGGQRWPERPWIPYNYKTGHNGCGYLIYPGPDGQPLSSIRLETVRDGIEDYEYLYLLRSLVDVKRADLPPALHERAQKLLAIPDDVVESHTEFTEDPGKILDTRAAIASLIEEIQGL